MTETTGRAATGNRSKEDTLRRVRALLAKAEAEGTTEPEAEALTAKAAELMASYGINQAMARAKANVKLVASNRIFDIDEPYANVKAVLINTIAKALHCDAILLGAPAGKARIHVFGFESELEQVNMLYTSLLLQMARAVARYKIPSWLKGRKLMAERRSVMLGFTAGVRPVLEAAYALAAANAASDGPGTALVLRSRDLAVQEAMREAYPRTRSTRVSYTGHGYGHGYEAGQNANVHNRDHVGAGSGRELGR